jgi:hypothetical protein
MESGAVFLRCFAAFELRDVPLGSPRPHELPSLEDPHQVIHEILGFAVSVDFVGLRILQAVTTANEASEVGEVLRV